MTPYVIGLVHDDVLVGLKLTDVAVEVAGLKCETRELLVHVQRVLVGFILFLFILRLWRFLGYLNFRLDKTLMLEFGREHEIKRWLPSEWVGAIKGGEFRVWDDV